MEPASIGFETQVGQGNPPTETLRIENAGGDTLDWTAVVETAQRRQLAQRHARFRLCLAPTHTRWSRSARM